MTDASARMTPGGWTGEDLKEQDFMAIMELLRERRTFRLDHYKERCVRRRIAKRLRAAGVVDMAAYLDQLQRDDDELDALLATLSIHVSRFFRNPDTFRVLEREVLPDLCHRAKVEGRSSLRLWSVGCAGGEEAYSLALLMDELNPSGLQIDILGTDVSDPVLEIAREGRYSRERLVEVPDSVLRRYFRQDGENYQLLEQVREMVRFERHNIMAAESYPPADLILCRNVLIYFSRVEQERILTRFSRAQSEGAVLVLGRSESLVGEIRTAYRSVFPVERVYRRVASEEDGRQS